MKYLIANNSAYLDMLRNNPGKTIYQKIDAIETMSAVRKERVETQRFIQSQPAYATQLFQRVVQEYRQYQRSEQPQIRNIQPSPIYVHSAAGPYELEILNVYKMIQNQIQKSQNRIKIKA